MERGAGTADEAVLVTGLSYVFYAGAFLAFYFLPLGEGTLSWSDLGWTGLSRVWPRLSGPAELLLAVPFLFTALAWGLGAKGVRPCFAGISRIGGTFVAAVALYLGMVHARSSGVWLSLWRWGLAAWLVYWSWRCLSRAAVLLRDRYGFGLGRALAALGVLAFAGFELLLFAAEAHARLLLRLSEAQRAVDWRPAPAASAPPAGASDCTRASALLTKIPSGQRDRLSAAARGPWRDSSGEWTRLLADDAAALDAVRRDAARPVCASLDASARPGGWPDLSRQVTLADLLILDARREESRGRVSAAVADYAAALAIARHAAAVGPPAALYGALVYAIVVRRLWPPLSELLERDLGSQADDRRLLGALEALSRGRPDFDALLIAERRSAHARNRRALESAAAFLRRGLRERALRRFDAEGASWLDRFAQALRAGPAAYAVPLDGLRAREPWLQTGEDPLWHCLARPGRLGVCWAAGEADVQGGYLMSDLAIRLARAQESVLTAGAALRLRQRERGAVPATLAMLTPELQAAPGDPFAGGASLRYLTDRAGGWTVYSVGPDRKDDKAQSIFAADLIDDWRRPPAGDVVLRGSP